VEREGFTISAVRIRNGKCANCRTLIPGVWG
jgi:hypothetical protein